MSDLRVEIVAGSPTAEDLAALTVALLGLASQAAPSTPPREPAWARAARLEGLGQAPLAAATDPRLR